MNVFTPCRMTDYQVMPELSADDFAALGHNSERELDLIASDARHGLDLVSAGEGKAIEGWLIFGAALNAGREKFPSDEQFGKWVMGNLPNTEHKERQAAMWAAANPLEFAEAQQLGDARTVRGIHAKWKEEQNRLAAEEAKRQAKDAEKAAKAAEKEAAKAEAKAKAENDEAARIEAERVAEEKRAAAEIAKAEAEEKKEAAKKATKGHYRTANTGENEWYTPLEFADAAREVMGGIDLDPASCAEANKVVGAAKFFTADDDGLSHHWSGRVWLNPPYSRDLMPLFVEKLKSSVPNIQAAIMVSHNNTDTGWFHSIAEVASAICFPNKRIKFYRGEDIAAPTNGQMFVYIGADIEAFRRTFSAFGLVVVPA